MTIGQAKQEFIRPSLTVQDLTETLYRASQELTEINARLKMNQQQQQELMINLSHDLRSPLSSILGDVEYLMALPPPKRDEELCSILGHIQSRAAVIEQIISDLLTVGTQEKTAEQMEYECLPIGPYLEEYFFSCQADVRFAAHTLRLEIPESFDFYVNIDPRQINRVLDNLFSNAVKYSDTPCTLTLSAGYERRQIVISLTDTGWGIPAQDLNRVFERTYRASSHRTPGDGNGLGLSIAKAIIEWHKGRIWCSSTVGEGSIFSFTLPECSAV